MAGTIGSFRGDAAERGGSRRRSVVGFIHNDASNSVYAEQYFAGVLDRGFWRARPADTIAVYRSVGLQPDAQYVIRPNAQANIRYAVVLGFRAYMGL